MVYQSQPIKVEGGQTKEVVSDDSVEQLLQRILLALDKVNAQLALMNDTVINEGESL